ncbi:hypothetical protein NDU88_001381 [Pleurodeles waltl]|uniref:Uncharacterized protein n=1 Tax=Pleurodeles waltl TaxID=8319 RepID=A0AAV7SZ59_PLEWA|nr:hypothetical protein NDU88_001381 [Pleurodeles waltl]
MPGPRRGSAPALYRVRKELSKMSSESSKPRECSGTGAAGGRRFLPRICKGGSGEGGSFARGSAPALGPRAEGFLPCRR